MNTKYVPALIMLLGGLVRCIIGIRDKEEFSIIYALSLLLVLVIFYIIGVIAKEILDKYITLAKEDENLNEEESSEEEKELENIQETNEDEASDEMQNL